MSAIKEVKVKLNRILTILTLVDFAGKRSHYLDDQTGKPKPCEVVVATLPSSGFMFSEAVDTPEDS